MPGIDICEATGPRSCPRLACGVRDPTSAARLESAMLRVRRGVGFWAKAEKEQNSRTVKKDGGTTRQIIRGGQSFQGLDGVGLEETLAHEVVGQVQESLPSSTPRSWDELWDGWRWAVSIYRKRGENVVKDN